MLKRKVHECADHFPMDQLVHVEDKDGKVIGYKLKWFALPHTDGIPPAPDLGVATQAVLRPIVVLRAAAAAKSADPRMPAVLSAAAKLMVQLTSVQRELCEVKSGLPSKKAKKTGPPSRKRKRPQSASPAASTRASPSPNSNDRLPPAPSVPAAGPAASISPSIPSEQAASSPASASSETTFMSPQVLPPWEGLQHKQFSLTLHPPSLQARTMRLPESSTQSCGISARRSRSQSAATPTALYTPGSGGGLNYSSEKPPPRDPDSGQYLSAYEVCDTTGDDLEETDGTERVAMRTVYKAKDLHTTSGNQRWRHTPEFWEGLQRTTVKIKSYAEHVEDRFPLRKNLLHQLGHCDDGYKLPSDRPSVQEKHRGKRW